MYKHMKQKSTVLDLVQEMNGYWPLDQQTRLDYTLYMWLQLNLIFVRMQTAALWDLRNLNNKLHSLKSHDEEVVQLAWSPHHDAILATASNDRRVFIWDLARISDEQSIQEAEDGPPELLV